MNTCIQMMETLGEEINNPIVVKKVLRTLLFKWSKIAIIFEETKDLTILTLDQLIGSFMSHEVHYWGCGREGLHV